MTAIASLSRGYGMIAKRRLRASGAFRQDGQNLNFVITADAF